MKIRWIAAITVSVIVIIAVVASINQGFTEEEKTVRVAFFPNVGHAIPIIGLEKGFFSSNLGQTTIQTRIFDSGPQAIEALFADSIDLAYVGPGPAINGFLQSEGKDLKILAGAASGGASFVVHPNSKIVSIEDLAGKKIAAPQIGNTQDVSLRHLISEIGLKPAEKGGSVIVLNTANAEIYTLFAKGDIDAAWVPEPWATLLVMQLNGKRLFYEEDLWPAKKFASVLLVGRMEYVQKHPEVVQKWLESHYKTADWINTNKDESKIVFNDFLQKYLGKRLPDEIVSESLDNIEITADPIKDSILIFVERADSLGYLGRHGYDLSGIFYEVQVESTQEVSITDG